MCAVPPTVSRVKYNGTWTTVCQRNCCGLLETWDVGVQVPLGALCLLFCVGRCFSMGLPGVLLKVKFYEQEEEEEEEEGKRMEE
jgi:hypothetical protein